MTRLRHSSSWSVFEAGFFFCPAQALWLVSRERFQRSDRRSQAVDSSTAIALVRV